MRDPKEFGDRWLRVMENHFFNIEEFIVWARDNADDLHFDNEDDLYQAFEILEGLMNQMRNGPYEDED